MIGIRCRDGRPFVDRHLPEPKPEKGEALVGIRLAGVCGTDRAVLAGYGGVKGVLGHEFAGEVIAAPGDPAWEGKRVVAGITFSCGSCLQCLQSRPGHCEKRRVLGIRDAEGVFAERVCIPTTNLVALPEPVPDEGAVFAEPLAAALRICEQVAVNPESDRILVIGAGSLGQLAARVLAGIGCRPSVVARYRSQKERLAVAGIASIGEGEGKAGTYDCVVEATGSQSGVSEALRMVRPGGTVVVKSSLGGRVPVDLSAVVVNEITLLGSRCGPIREAVAWLAEGKIDPTDLIDARFALTDAPAAFERAAAPGAMKVLLNCLQQKRGNGK